MTASKQHIPTLILIGLAPFFFIGGPDEYSQRSYEMLWNLGHILFFTGLTVLLSNRKTVRADFTTQCMAAIILSIVIGTAIELLQSKAGRSTDVGDLFMNIVGVMVALFFILPSRKTLPRKRRLAFQLITIVAVGSQVLPALTAIADESIARKQFPVLSNLETPFEIGRWEGDSIAIDKKIKQAGNASLKVQLNGDRSVGVKLLYFPRDWRNYDYFQFSIYTPSTVRFSIACRIKDRKKTLGKSDADESYNRQFELNHGWNTLIVKLSDLEASLSHRRMDLSRIYGIRFFATDLSQPKTIYIDNLKLGKNT